MWGRTARKLQKHHDEGLHAELEAMSQTAATMLLQSLLGESAKQLLEPKLHAPRYMGMEAAAHMCRTRRHGANMNPSAHMRWVCH